MKAADKIIITILVICIIDAITVYGSVPRIESDHKEEETTLMTSIDTSEKYTIEEGSDLTRKKKIRKNLLV